MRFDDLEILDLNGDEDRVVRFPGDSPNDTEEINCKTHQGGT